MAKNHSTPTPEGGMAPICEAIDAVLRGYCVRIGDTIIKEVETIQSRDGVVVYRNKELMQFDVDDLLNGRFDADYFRGWEWYIKHGIKEFSIVDFDKFKNLKSPACTTPESDEDD